MKEIKWNNEILQEFTDGVKKGYCAFIALYTLLCGGIVCCVKLVDHLCFKKDN